MSRDLSSPKGQMIAHGPSTITICHTLSRDVTTDQSLKSHIVRRALQKLLALVLAVGLAAGGPVCSSAQMNPCGSAGSHETLDVPIYADLSVDPADEDSLQAQPMGGVAHHEGGFCQKCCAACLGANLPPAAPVALAIPSASQQMALTLDGNLVARAVPTEPGIPKPH